MSIPFPNERLTELQAEFAKGWQDLLSQSHKGELANPKDRRFSGDAWAANPAFLFMANAYMLSAETMQKMVDAVDMPEHTREKLRFATMQWLDAMAPSNFLATNPDAQHALVQSKGMSLVQGVQNFYGDLQKGYLSQTDESKFTVGENLAITDGQVVFENPLFQLVQYTPLTEKVHEIPLLIVPPCINKFYILDLQPENSLVRYAVEQGFTVFLVSWRNPQPSDTDGILQATWADFLQSGVLQAVDVVKDITQSEKINALGFCVGGTLLASALALAKARGQDPVNSLTLLTTLLDFEDTGVIDIFIDEANVRRREQQLGGGGIMPARELATTFSFLRPNELVWNYVVANYLKGQTPPAFDLLYWNSDGTNMPGPFFAWYLRNTYLENNLKVPGKVVVDGTPVSLSDLTMPTYLYGSREDHIVPWKSAYASSGVLKGPMQFVMGASGHIAGVVNPPAKKKRNYWVSPGSVNPATLTADEWLEKSEQHPGSWWPHWSSWLASHSGAHEKTAIKTLGNARYQPLESAPGRYVKVRSA
ncbi:MAG: class I poly(R)-hydroxyalkanoic acid synthase [Pusillimonas sp.]